MLAGIAGAELVTPPRAVLGRFLKTGDGNAIAAWLDGLDLSRVDAVIVSADMLAYGGLIGSREPRVLEADARRRVASLGALKRRRADLPVYAFSTIMRLAPTADGRNEGWREKLARWAEISPKAAATAAVAAEVAELERGLPAGMIEHYRQARARNVAVTLALVDLVRRDAIDFLLVGQDDPKPDGVHVADRLAIEQAIAQATVGARTGVQPGADEAGMLLLARALAATAAAAPRMEAIYSSAESRDAVMPLDDRPLSQTVKAHLAVAGATLDTRGTPSGLALYVYASRHESPDQAAPFARRIADAVDRGRRVIVVDIDIKGDLQGASLPFTEALRNARVFARLAGYASWNTAGNTIGTAVPQGLLYALALDRVAPISEEAARAVALAQAKFLIHRLVTDFIYHGVVRPQAIEEMLQPRQIDPMHLDSSQQLRVEKYLTDEVQPLADSLVADFNVPWRLPGQRRRAPLFTVRDLRDFRLILPWGRMSEADVDFALVID